MPYQERSDEEVFWMILKYIGAGFLVLFALIMLLKCTVSIAAGSTGVVTRFGAVQDKTLAPGFHLKNPLDRVHEVDMRVGKDEAKASAASKDLQSVTANVAVNSHFDPAYIIRTYSDVGIGDGIFTINIVDPAIQNAIKAATAQFTAEELITKRSEVSALIESLLVEALKPYAIVDSVAITNFDFSESFNSAIEAKATAEQDALAQKNKLEQVKYEAEQSVVQAQAQADSTKVKAEAEAEAIRITAQALANNPKLVELEAVKQWDGKLPQYMTGDAVPFLDIK